MFKKKDLSSSQGFDTLIGTNTTFVGNIESSGSIRIDGRLNGDLKVEGDIFIGSNAEITGNIYANNVQLAGMVEGNIESVGILRILSTAKLFGDINVHSFVADEGGVFHGKCCMIDSPQEALSSEKSGAKRPHSSRDYKKSSVLAQMEDKDKPVELIEK